MSRENEEDANSTANFSVVYKLVAEEYRAALEVSDQLSIFCDAVRKMKEMLGCKRQNEMRQKEMERIFLLLLDILNEIQVGTSLQTIEASITFCELVTLLAEKQNTSSKLRHIILEKILCWNSELIQKKYLTKCSTIGTAVTELEAMLMKTTCSLSKRLVLEASSFYKIFDLYVFIFEQLTIRKDGREEFHDLLDGIMTALIFLTASNINFGIERFVASCYNKNVRFRWIILNLLSQNVFVSSDYGIYVLLFVSTPFQIHTKETTELIKLFVNIFEYQQKMIEFLNPGIIADVVNCERATMLFRTNSAVTHVIAEYMKLVGNDYLKKALKPQLRYLLSTDIDLEVDPSKIGDKTSRKEILETNISNLRRICSNFLMDIYQALPFFPRALRLLCNYLVHHVESKFAGIRRRVISSFVFLRLICPAIASPDSHGIISNIACKNRRNFMIIARILQTLANNVRFSTKEVYMQCMNQWLIDSQPFFESIIDQIQCIPENSPILNLLITDEENTRNILAFNLFIDSMKSDCVGCQ